MAFFAAIIAAADPVDKTIIHVLEEIKSDRSDHIAIDVKNRELIFKT